MGEALRELRLKERTDEDGFVGRLELLKKQFQRYYRQGEIKNIENIFRNALRLLGILQKLF